MQDLLDATRPTTRNAFATSTLPAIERVRIALNFYDYAGQDPINNYDLDGLMYEGEGDIYEGGGGPSPEGEDEGSGSPRAGDVAAATPPPNLDTLTVDHIWQEHSWELGPSTKGRFDPEITEDDLSEMIDTTVEDGRSGAQHSWPARQKIRLHLWGADWRHG